MRFSKTIQLLLFSFVLYLSSGQAQTLEQRYPTLDSLYKAENYKQVASLESQIQPSLENRSDTLVTRVVEIFGMTFLSLGDDPKAIRYMEQERTLRLTQPQTNLKNYSNLLYNLTYVHNQAGQYKQALAYGDELLATDKKLFGQSSTEYAASVIFVLDVLINQGNLTRAKELASATITSIPKKDSMYAMVLNKYADLHQLTGEYTRSEKLFKESLTRLTANGGPNQLNYQNVAVNLANLYVSEGRIPEAEKIFSTALSYYRSQTENPEAEVSYFSTLNNRALALHSLSLYDEAISIYTELLFHDSKVYGNDHPFYSITLNNLANVLISKGQLAGARELLRQSLEVSMAVNGPESTDAAIQYNNIANTFRLEGNYDSALLLYRQASAIFLKESGAESLEYGTSLFNIGKALLGKNSPEAKAYLLKALKLRKKQLGTKHPRYGEVLQKLAFYHWKTNNTKVAHDYFNQLLANYYEQVDMYFPILSEEEKAKFYYSKFKVDQEAYISFVLDKLNTDSRALGSLYDLALNTKGLIFYASQKVRVAILQSKDQELIAKYENWLSVKEKIAKAHSEGSEEASSLKRTDSLLVLANVLEKELVVKSAEFKNVYSKRVYSWQEVQQKLKPGEAAIEVIRFRTFSPDEEGYFSGKVNYVALVLTTETKTGPRIVTWKNGGEMEGRLLSYYRNTTRFQMTDTLSYNQFWKPLQEVLKGINKVFFCPDGVFHQINPNTLYNPQEKRFVADEITIELITNTRDLLTQASSKKSNSGAYLFGFPDYETLKLLEPKEEEKATAQRSTRALSRALRSGFLRSFLRGNGIPPLPGTKTEVENIANEFKSHADNYKTFFQKQANEFEIKQVKNPSILHIATHGFFLDDGELSVESASQQKFLDNPLFLSGLILATGISDNHLEDEDGILTAYESMNMFLDDTDIVVLSACETGLGTIKNGEGIYGLQRSFKVAGAKTLIMSMWNVDDEATQILMSNFYKSLLSGMNKQAAFVNAQQKLREKYPAPFYWGAFVMIGN